MRRKRKTRQNYLANSEHRQPPPAPPTSRPNEIQREVLKSKYNYVEEYRYRGCAVCILRKWIRIAELLLTRRGSGNGDFATQLPDMGEIQAWKRAKSAIVSAGSLIQRRRACSMHSRKQGTAGSPKDRVQNTDMRKAEKSETDLEMGRVNDNATDLTKKRSERKYNRWNAQEIKSKRKLGR